jgi:hypothetical protein
VLFCRPAGRAHKHEEVPRTFPAVQPSATSNRSNKGDAVTFNEAFELMGRDEAFRATVYAMNTLLIKKGVYTTGEFEQLFCEHAINFKRSFSARTASTDASSATSLSNR